MLGCFAGGSAGPRESNHLEYEKVPCSTAVNAGRPSRGVQAASLCSDLQRCGVRLQFGTLKIRCLSTIDDRSTLRSSWRPLNKSDLQRFFEQFLFVTIAGLLQILLLRAAKRE
jgi:hypothetical protein